MRVRFVDRHGVPVEGVSFRLADSDLSPSSSGRDGVARLTLEQVLADGRTLTFEARCRGFALERRQARATEEPELLLEDWSLDSAGSVEGQVVDEDGHGIPGVEVARLADALSLRDWERRRRANLGALGEPGIRATTGPDGAFRLDDVPSGAIRIVAVAVDRPAALSEPVEVPAGGLASGVRLEMDEADGGTTITGIVLDPGGEPVAHARITIRSEGSQYGLQTGGDGRFEFRALDKRPVDLLAEDPERRHRDAPRTGVVPGARGIELRLREAPDVALTVRAAGGQPIERYAVAVVAQSTHQVLAFQPEEARAGGGCSLPVPAEDFFLEVRANGWKTARVGPFPPDEPVRIECVLEPARGLHGRVTAGGAPLGGARLALHEVLTANDTHNGFPIRIVPEPAVVTRSRADGTYLLSVDAPGEYSLLAEADGQALTEVGPIILGPDTDHELDVELGSGGALAVRVRSTRGSSVAGRLVACSRGDGRARTRRTNEHGELELEFLTPGAWLVRLVDEEIDPAGGARYFGSAPRGEIPSNCRVLAGQTTPLDLWLEEPGDEACRLVGRLTINGAGAQGWQVAMDRDEAVVLDAQSFGGPGHFRVGVAQPGRYRLRLSSGTADPGAMLVILDAVDLSEGEQAWALDLRTGVLEGTLAATSAEALHFHRVRMGARELLAPLVPDPDGRFRCKLAPAGRGEIVRYDPNLPLGEQRPVLQLEVTIEAGRTTTIEL